MDNQPTLFDQVLEPEVRRDSFGIVPTFRTLTRFELLAQQGVPPVPMNLTIDPTRLVRTQDPDTSRKAAESASRRGPSQRRRVWEALQKLGGATDYELSVECGILRSSAAKRRQELVDLGHVVETPFRRKTDTGTEAIVWRCSLASSYSGS
ncbi:Helix-turn-helix domain containing protein [uncultured Caudovirales phage]|uniref:Helix-turn-helix domain containing protein n=1 Tax=uncultured Caudovirales phage TaxID=2100421 RepID=A0A6J5M698_9CAUD|nr:Helix-turn-helix domain containing protein [uncultured Caudovirales phage]CAB4158600.1 Helix-turn-helix domain containing protein [uncultured Caudovirales phage]